MPDDKSKETIQDFMAIVKKAYVLGATDLHPAIIRHMEKNPAAAEKFFKELERRKFKRDILAKEIKAQDDAIDARTKQIESYMKLTGSVEAPARELEALNALINRRRDLNQRLLDIDNEAEFIDKPQGDRVLMPDPENPGEQLAVTFPSGYLADVLRSPESLQSEVARLQDEIELGVPNAREQLAAIQQTVTRNQLQDVLQAPAQELEPRHTPMEGFIERLQNAFGSVNIDRGSKANAPAPTSALTSGDLTTAIKRRARRRNRARANLS